MTRISRSFFVGKYASAYIAEKGVSVRVFDTQIYKCCFYAVFSGRKRHALRHEKRCSRKVFFFFRKNSSKSLFLMKEKCLYNGFSMRL